MRARPPLLQHGLERVRLVTCSLLPLTVVSDTRSAARFAPCTARLVTCPSASGCFNRRVLHSGARNKEEEMRDKAFSICREFLSGSWKKISSHDMVFKSIR